MPIDWFTVCAQIVNFLVLVWLLKRFLYTPILRALDEREKKIADEKSQVEQEKQQAEREQSEYKRMIQEFEQQRAELFKQAGSEVGKERQRLLEHLEEEIREIRTRQIDEVNDVYSTRKEELRQRLVDGSFSLTARILGDLAAADLEELLVDRFLATCRGIDPGKRDLLAARLQERQATILIRSAYPLAEEQRKKLQVLCGEVFNYHRPLRFEESRELVCGIALSADGYEIVWNFSQYLQEVQAKFDEQFLSACSSDPA
jgi:F-type H+-transporting ATPase subunit b